MARYFTFDVVFPIVARIVTARSAQTGDFVPHREIVTAMLQAQEGAEVLDRVIAQGWKHSRAALASNMVAWFSQQVTLERNPYAQYFKRSTTRPYSYQPVTHASTALGPDIDVEAIEGEPRLVSHVRRERSRRLVEAKKEQELARSGRLRCEACGFDFREHYPGLNMDFCEVHHNRPLADALGPEATRLEDLTLLCSNCHRMIHKKHPMPTVDQFRDLLKPRI